MTRTILLLNLVGFVFGLNGCTQTSTKPQDKVRKPGSSLLWRISGNNMETESYLYGTIHIQDSRVFKYGDVVKSAFNLAEVVAVEVELDKVDYATIMNVTMMQDSTLDQILTPEEYEQLNVKYTELTGASLKTANRIKPFFLSANIIQAIVKKDAPVPLDLYFINEGRIQQKTVLGLETINEQIDIIDKLSYTAQAKMLLESLADTVNIVEMFNEMVEAYLRMDGEQLLELSNDPSIPAEFMKELLVDRNHLMVERMKPIMGKKKVFTAVGAAHLFGSEGVIELLKKEGYTVEAVEFDFE